MAERERRAPDVATHRSEHRGEVVTVSVRVRRRGLQTGSWMRRSPLASIVNRCVAVRAGWARCAGACAGAGAGGSPVRLGANPSIAANGAAAVNALRAGDMYGILRHSAEAEKARRVG